MERTYPLNEIIKAVDISPNKRRIYVYLTEKDATRARVNLYQQLERRELHNTYLLSKRGNTITIERV